jgi:hypothetical protein
MGFAQPSFVQLSSLLFFFVVITSLYIIPCMNHGLFHTLTFIDMWGVSCYLSESMEIICKCGILVIIIIIN